MKIKYCPILSLFLLLFINSNVIAQVMPFGMLHSNNGTEPDDTTQNIDPSCIESISSINAGALPNSVAVWGDYAYVTDQNEDKIYVYNVSNKRSPILENEVATAQLPWKIAIANGYAFVATNAYLQVFDLSNPELPVLNQSINDQVKKLKVSGNYLYTTGGFKNDLKIYDISTPTSVQTIGTIVIDDTFNENSINNENRINKTINNLIISGNYAFLTMSYDEFDEESYTHTTTSKLWAVNISNPTQPVILGNIDFEVVVDEYNYIPSLGILGNYAYITVSNDYEAIKVIDISDPSSLTISNTVPVSESFFSMTISGTFALASGFGLFVYDLSTTPTHPSLVTWTNSVGFFVKYMIVSDNYAYAINFNNTLEIFRLNCSG